jgi:hypothetical protein
MACSSLKHHSDSAYLSEKTTTAIGVFLIPSSIDSQHSSPVQIDLQSRYGCNPCFLRSSYKNPTNPVFVSRPLWLKNTSYFSNLSAHQQGHWLIQVTEMSNFPNYNICYQNLFYRQELNQYSTQENFYTSQNASVQTRSYSSMWHPS